MDKRDSKKEMIGIIRTLVCHFLIKIKKRNNFKIKQMLKKKTDD